MSSYISYEILVNLKQIDVINIRQSSFFQIRVTVLQTVSKDITNYAVPFLIFKSEPQNKNKPVRNSLDPLNVSEIDASNNSFLTRKFIIRNVDEEVNINEMCLFKGILAMGEGGNFNREIKIYIELFSYQQTEAEVVTDWQGHTFHSVGHSYIPIYFNSYKCTCNLNTTIHVVASSLSLENILSDGKLVSASIQQLGNVRFLKKYSQELESSMEQLKKEIKSLNIKLQNMPEAKEIIFEPQVYRYGIFKKQSALKSLSGQEIKKIEQSLNEIPMNNFMSQFKDYINLLNQINYQLWKKLQLGLINEYNQTYENEIKSRYNKQLSAYHKQKSLFDENGKPISQTSSNGLFVHAFQNHQTFFKMSKENYDLVFSLKPSTRKQILVFVHGYQASSFDMEPISNYLKYKYPNVMPLLSTVNEGRTEQQIQQSAHRLAIEVKNFINSIQIKDFQLNFLCHSLGGIIARACLKYLQSHKNRLNNFVTICSPHLGYLYHSSTLISTSLWILNKVKKDPSMIELTMSDSNELGKTYLYGLSMSKELSSFKHIWLFGSKEDEYVPYWSAILQDKNFFFETESSKIYKQLLQNITKEIEPKIIRCEIIYNQKSKDISNLIGRTAHIKLLNYLPGIQLFNSIFVP